MCGVLSLPLLDLWQHILLLTPRATRRLSLRGWPFFFRTVPFPEIHLNRAEERQLNCAADRLGCSQEQEDGLQGGAKSVEQQRSSPLLPVV